MNTWEIISLVVNLVTKLYPIAREVYDQVNNPHRQDITRETALYYIKAMAGEKGLKIGNTEARIAKDIVHYVRTKKHRHFKVMQV